MPTLTHYEDPSGLLVPKLLDMFLAEVQQDPHLYDDRDVEALKATEWHVMRFILNNFMDIDRAHRQLTKFMRWQKEIGLRNLKDSDFPAEFYSIGACFGYACDKKNNPTLYIRVKYVKRVPEIMNLLKLFFLYIMRKVDDASRGYGWTLIFDFSGATVANCDFELVNFLITSMCEYFPCGVDYILTVDLPWILNAVWKLIRACIPDHSKGLVLCADRKTILDYVGIENLPDFLGGSCELTYTEVPTGCITTEEYSFNVLGLSCKQVNKLMDKFRPLMQAT